MDSRKHSQTKKAKKYIGKCIHERNMISHYDDFAALLKNTDDKAMVISEKYYYDLCILTEWHEEASNNITRISIAIFRKIRCILMGMRYVDDAPGWLIKAWTPNDDEIRKIWKGDQYPYTWVEWRLFYSKDKLGTIKAKKDWDDAKI